LNLMLIRIWKKGYNKGDGNKEGSNTCMSNTSFQYIEN